MTSPQPGWYPDPAGDATKLRYWNGAAWTDDFMPNPEAAAAPAPDPAQVTANIPGPAPAASQTQNYYVNVNMADPVPQPMSETDRVLRLIAFILNVLSCVGAGILIIPLAWMIPTTVRSWNIYKGVRPNTVGFGVLDLIFTNMVSGVLLLCSEKDI